MRDAVPGVKEGVLGGAQYVVCSVNVKRENRVLRRPCPTAGHVVHSECALDLLKIAAAAAPLCCPGEGCGTRHNHRLILDNIAWRKPDGNKRVAALGGRRSVHAPADGPARHFLLFNIALK